VGSVLLWVSHVHKLRLGGAGPERPKNFGTSYTFAYTAYHILHGEQTRYEDIFIWSTMPLSWPKFLLTRMLTHDLFAVANPLEHKKLSRHVWRLSKTARKAVVLSLWKPRWRNNCIDEKGRDFLQCRCALQNRAFMWTRSVYCKSTFADDFLWTSGDGRWRRTLRSLLWARKKDDDLIYRCSVSTIEVDAKHAVIFFISST